MTLYRRSLMGRAAGLAAAALLACAAAPSFAQAWPNKPVRIVVPYGAGSSPDVIARLIADKLSPGSASR